MSNLFKSGIHSGAGTLFGETDIPVRTVKLFGRTGCGEGFQIQRCPSGKGGGHFRFSGGRVDGGRGTLDLAESSGQVGGWTSDVVEPKRTGKGEGFHSPFPSPWPLQSTHMKRHFPQAAQAPLLHDARPMTSDARRPTIHPR